MNVYLIKFISKYLKKKKTTLKQLNSILELIFYHAKNGQISMIKHFMRWIDVLRNW